MSTSSDAPRASPTGWSIAVLENPRKISLLTASERVRAIEATMATLATGSGSRPATIEVTTFDGLTVDFCRRVGATAIVRGLRGIGDFETELSLAHNNASSRPDVETVCLMTALEVAYISSSLVKEIARSVATCRRWCRPPRWTRHQGARPCLSQDQRPERPSRAWLLDAEGEIRRAAVDAS